MTTAWPRLSFLALVSCILISPQCLADEYANPGWARFCGTDSDGQEIHHDIYTNECPAGGWLDTQNGIKWNCICTIGTFNVRFSWCKHEEPVADLGTGGYARFTPNDITCFRVSSEVTNDQTIHGVLAMHKYSDRDEEDFPYIWTKASGGTILSHLDLNNDVIQNMTVHPNDSIPYAIRVNPRPHTYFAILNRATKKAVCLLPPNATQGTPGIFYSYSLDFLWLSGRDLKPAKMGLFMRSGCYLRNENFTYTTVAGRSLEDYVVPRLDPGEVHADCIKCLNIGSPFEQKNITEDCQSSDKDDGMRLNYEIDMQSERLGNYWIDFMLQKDSSHMKSDEFQELVILRKAAIMAYGACNMNYIPRQFYQFFMILFQALITESSLTYPPQPPLETKHYQLILKNLDKCMQNTQPYRIRIDNATCPPEVEYSEYLMPEIRRYIPIEVPPELIASPDEQDYLLEFAWKLSSFLQYHCHEYFKESPVLQHALQVQLENLFSDYLQTRWRHPANSLFMFDAIFKTNFDFVKTMENFERCVAIANKLSSFKGWLKKPINQPMKLFRPEELSRRKRRSNARDRIFPKPEKNSTAVYAPHEAMPENLVYIDLPEDPSLSASVQGVTDLENTGEVEQDTSKGRNSDNCWSQHFKSYLPRNTSYLNWEDNDLTRSKEINKHYGTFRGDLRFACLLSLSDFLAKNPSYSFGTDLCF